MAVATRARLRAQNLEVNPGASSGENDQTPSSAVPSPAASPPASSSASSPDQDQGHPQSHSSPAQDTFDANTEASEPEDDERSMSTVGGRGRGWLPWQDRLLIAEVKALRPFQAPHGSRTEAWDEVASKLAAESKGKIIRTGTACQGRFAKLVKAHRANETKSLQATGTNEEVDEHIESLTEIVQLLDDAKLESERLSAKTAAKVQTERRAGLELRSASLKGLVQAKELQEDLGNLEGATVRERQGQRKSPVSDAENEPGPSRPFKKRQTLKAKVGDMIQQFEDAEGQILQQALEREEAREHRENARHEALLGELQGVRSTMDRVADALTESSERKLLLDVVNTFVSKQK